MIIAIINVWGLNLKGMTVLWSPEGKNQKISILAVVTGLTLAIHYGWVFEPLFGHIHWFHILHGRFCYIPIVIGASWFGLRGGLAVAAIISILIMPLIISTGFEPNELVEIVFYFFIAGLIGVLVEREFFAKHKQQEAELQLERFQKLSLVGQIAAGVAHEIKNPLASIKGAADILADENTSADARKEFQDILSKEVRRIDSTVSEFLLFARPRESRFAHMNLSDLIRSCVKQVSSQAERDGISFDCCIAESVMVTGDEEKLRQMGLNLILNAQQASKPGSTIEICLSIVDDKTAELQIIDSGKGISEESLLRIFEPFYTTKASGTGLGLAIVKSIVENHSGDISLTSRLDQGTTATILLPITQGNG